MNTAVASDAAANWCVQIECRGERLLRTRIIEPVMTRPGAPRPSSPRSRLEAVLIERLALYFQGYAVDFADIELDDSHVGGARSRIYGALRAVARGTTLSYGELAARAGMPGGARFAGQCMASNPWPIIVPCHHVIRQGEGLGGFSAPGGRQIKEALLRLEGCAATPQFELPGLCPQKRADGG